MEKCFLDDKISDKKEKNSFIMLRNEKLSFQVAYSFEKVYNALFEVELGGTLAKYASVKQVVSVPVSYPVRNDTGCNSDCIRNTPGLYPDVIRPLHYNGKVRVVENQLHALWVDIKLSDNTAITDGELVITLNGKNISVSATAQVHVVNAELPPQRLIHTEWFYTDCIAEAYHTTAFSEKHWKYIESYIKMAVDNGINMILTPVHTPPLDTETGLAYYGARYYSPELSIWYGVDPLMEKYLNSSPYVFCAGNPVKYIDPNGKACYESRSVRHAKKYQEENGGPDKKYNAYNKNKNIVQKSPKKVQMCFCFLLHRKQRRS